VERPMTRWLRSQFLTVFAVKRGGAGQRLREVSSSVTVAQPAAD
jgi:exopolysaccharide production protein ExoZ